MAVPGGRCWPCPDCEHQQAAEAIVRDVGLSSDRDDEKVLEEAGWVHISDNGMVHSFLGATILFPDFTQARLTAMFDPARPTRPCDGSCWMSSRVRASAQPARP
jgi:hypothetical protein